MSKRNFVLLIIILVIALAVVFFFWFTRQTVPPGTGEPGINFNATFNPFGSGTKTPPSTTPPADVSGYQPEPGEQVKLKLQKVSSIPVAGFVVYSKERLKEINPSPALPLTGAGDNSVPPAKGDSGGLKTTKPLTEIMPALRYVDRATGNIFETFADKINEKQFSKTVIPQVYEAYFGNKGESVVMRYLKADGQTIQTFVGNLPKEYLGTEITGNAEIKGSFLPDNIKDASLSPDASSILYLFNNRANSADSVAGTTLNFITSKKTQIFTSPFTEWLSQWPNSRMITLTTKPASGIPGYMYMVDPNSANKMLSQVLGKINGLTTLTSPNGKLVLYGDDGISLNVYHADTKTSAVLGVKTLPEKCVWGSANDAVYCAVPKTLGAGAYPDAWYQGEISFSDQIWKVDIKTGNAALLADPLSISGEEVDGIKLALDGGENYLFFVNKKDSFLWEFGLK